MREELNVWLRKRHVCDKQDGIDNVIHAMVSEILGKVIPWNIEVIGEVRDAILPILAEHYGVAEAELYPTLEEE